MSQKTLLIALTFAIVLTMTIEAEAKRIGCASFGHSCYGGHGKRSDPSLAAQEIDTIDQQQPPLGIIRILQRRFNIQSESPANELTPNDREREGKLVILSVLRDAVDETYRKLIAAKDQDIQA